MKPSQLTKALTTLIAMRQPACIWSSPGIGKSSIIHQLAETLYRSEYRDWSFDDTSRKWVSDEGLIRRLPPWIREMRGSQLDAVDVRGIPRIIDNRTQWVTPETYPLSTDGRPGIWFLDELNRTPGMVQNSLLQVLTPPHQLGEYEFPIESWSIVSACNPKGTGVQKMDYATRSRFCNLNLEIDTDDWCAWAAGAGVCAETIAFIRVFPALLDVEGECNPRSWEFVSKITDSKPDPELEHELYQGHVGSQAVEYTSFLRLFASMAGLVDSIFLDPSTARIPEDASSLYAVSAALARRSNDKNLATVTKYLDRFPQQEYAVFAIQDAVRRDRSLLSVKAFTKWAIAHSDVIF